MTNDHHGSARDVGAAVRAFYDRLPFNFHGTVGRSVAAVRDHSIAASYPDLHALLSSGRVRQVLEIGCGTGWLCNSLALNHVVEVAAVDFCANALARARDVARALGTASRVRFIESDLFDYHHDGHADLVISLGVLHHTGCARSAFRHIQAFAGTGGSVYVGLYHAPGRQVFLETFRSIAVTRGEEAAFRRFRAIEPARSDDEMEARSWFRDQVMHPHETQHTLREISEWLTGAGLTLQSTSINAFAPIGDVALLFAQEPGFRQRSRRALAEGRFFPGFFTFLASRP